MESPHRKPSKGPGQHGKSQWGAGWGGPANGTPAHRKPGWKKNLPPEVLEQMEEMKAIRREKILAMFLEVAEDKEQPAMARITAGDRYLDRTEGKAVQAVVNHDGGEKTLEDLVKESMAVPTTEPAGE